MVVAFRHGNLPLTYRAGLNGLPLQVRYGASVYDVPVSWTMSAVWLTTTSR